MLESNTIDIQYVPQSQLQGVLSSLESQNATPLILLAHHQAAVLPLFKPEFKPEFKPKFISLHSGLDSVEYNNEPCYELWSAGGIWQQGKQVCKTGDAHDISFFSNEQYLIGSLSVHLYADHSLQECTQNAYQQLIDFINQQGKSHLLRMWNYFPDINAEENKVERYQQFCVGRHNAFAKNTASTIDYPAASAVGSHSCRSSKLVIAFIATKKAAVLFENPDQISAYHYPAHYSPKSPSFARAACSRDMNGQLFISGTASIVGHQSCFHDDVVGQTQQTIKNLKSLLEHANSQQDGQRIFSLSARQAKLPAVKIYLRKPADRALVSPIIEAFLPECDNICYLQADICRQELAIEIEMVVGMSLL